MNGRVPPAGFGNLRERAAAAVQPMLIAAWCALAAGLLEGVRHAIWRFGLDRLVFVSVDVFWMAPLSYLAFFAVPAGMLAMVAWFRPRWVPLSLPVLVFAALASFGVLSLLGRPRINFWALGLLALGIAVQAARTAHARPAAVLGFARRSGAWLAVAVVVVLLWIPVGRPIRERLQLASLPDAPASALNVLLIILDTVRGENLSVYGYHQPTTPNLVRLGGEGVVFDNAIAPAPWTLPSHASAFTGHWPHELSADWERPLDDAWLTLAESFRARGYNTGAFVANLLYTGRDAGLARGFVHFSDQKRSRRQLLLSSFLGQVIENWRTRWWTRHPVSDRKLAPEVSGDFLEWVDRSDGRPFFAFLNYYDAHLPYQAPPEFRNRFRSGKRELDGYDAAIAHLDHELGRLFTALDRRGALDNTIVVVASDHGELFGEHGLTEHGNSLYEPLLRIPLILRHPATLPAGKRIANLVSLRSLPATLTELTHGTAEFPGVSLTALWSTDRAPQLAGNSVLAEVSRGVRTPPHEPVSRGPMKSVFTERYHYIRNGDGKEELYDLGLDRSELHDLAGTRASGHVLLRFRHSLDQLLTEARLARKVLR